MKKIFFLMVLILLTQTVFSTETGQYRYYTYGQDFNIINFVWDSNGMLDNDWSSDCNVSSQQESTGLLLLDQNHMSGNASLSGAFYIQINASNTSIWTIGKYSTVMTCKDGNDWGTENISFILDKDIIETIIDTNAIGRGLNDDQNQILYDVNKWLVNPAIDTQGPIIIITRPLNNSTITGTLIEFSAEDSKSNVNTIQTYVNGSQSLIFNQLTDCATDSQNIWKCSYFEPGLNINAINDVNVIGNDDYNNITNVTTSFLYSSVGVPTGGGTGINISESISIVGDNNFTVNYVKGEQIPKTITLKNNTGYDLFITFTPSTELNGKFFLKDFNSVMQPHEEKSFGVYFLNNSGPVSGSIVVASQFSSVNVPVEFVEKPFNYMWLLLFIIIVALIYFLFMYKK